MGDGMESFYYIILYASILSLPHEQIDDIEDLACIDVP